MKLISSCDQISTLFTIYIFHALFLNLNIVYKNYRLNKLFTL